MAHRCDACSMKHLSLSDKTIPATRDYGSGKCCREITKKNRIARFWAIRQNANIVAVNSLFSTPFSTITDPTFIAWNCFHENPTMYVLLRTRSLDRSTACCMLWKPLVNMCSRNSQERQRLREEESIYLISFSAVCKPACRAWNFTFSCVSGMMYAPICSQGREEY